MNNSQSFDFLIIGAGIVGLTIARQLRLSWGSKVRILVIEKEQNIGLHSSGRNSGVMHSGIYYPAHTLKAKICGEGGREMTDWCEDRKLPVRRIGKVLVPVSKADASQIKVLMERGIQNGVLVERLDEQQLRELEPEVRSATGEAIWCPVTSVIDPKAVLNALAVELANENIEIRTNTAFLAVDRSHQTIRTSAGKIHYGYVVNAAGLFADKIAHVFGIAENLTLLPFKGIYWQLAPSANLDIRHLIYPVPDLRVPFLGVHTTTSIEGTIYFGPTAVPAWGRENYSGCNGLSIKDTGNILYRLAQQFVDDKQGFRRLARQEMPRYFKPAFVKAAQAIVPKLRAQHLQACHKVGIRAQMLDTQKGELVMDFLIENGDHETHILNAISPAFTSAFPFARFVVDNFIHKR